MPALRKAVIDKIKAGEFINFDSLLPNHSPVSDEDFAFKVGGGGGSESPSVSLVPKHQAKSKVTNFNSWMVASTNFVRAYSIFWPYRLQELVHYQATICDFANQFPFVAWSNYDRMFQYRLAREASLSWSRVDDDIFNRCLRGAPLQNLCYTCRNFGHNASACPLRAAGTSCLFRWIAALLSLPARFMGRGNATLSCPPPPQRPMLPGPESRNRRHTVQFFQH